MGAACFARHVATRGRKRSGEKSGERAEEKAEEKAEERKFSEESRVFDPRD